MSDTPARFSPRERARARRAAVQALYQWQLSGQDPRDILNEFIAERELNDVDRAYFGELTREVPKCTAELDRDLAEVVERPLEQLDPVERAVLWIGAYELQHNPSVPWRVVVNEGVELAKMFGGEQGFRLVNAALDRLARRLRGEEVARLR